MALGPDHLSAPGLEARPKMGIFRWNRPHGVALLRLRETSLSLSDRHTRRYYLGMKPEKKPPCALVMMIWFLIFMGAALIVSTLAAFLVVLFLPFSA